MLDSLIREVWQRYHTADSSVGKPAIPVLCFGDYERYARSSWNAVSVEMNPSSNEFPAHDRFQRFASAHDRYPGILDGKFSAEYLAAPNNSFRTGNELA